MQLLQVFPVHFSSTLAFCLLTAACGSKAPQPKVETVMLALPQVVETEQRLEPKSPTAEGSVKRDAQPFRMRVEESKKPDSDSQAPSDFQSPKVESLKALPGSNVEIPVPPQPFEAKPNQIKAEKVRVDFLNQSYQIDRFLSIAALNKYRISLNPNISNEEKPIPNGIYRVIGVLLDGNDNKTLQDRYAVQFDQSVESVSGNLTFDVTLEFGYKNLWAKAAYTEIAIQILPVSKTLKGSQTLSGMLNPDQDSADIVLKPLGWNLEERLPQLRRGLEMPQMLSKTNLELYKEAFGFRFYLAKEFSGNQFGARDFQALFEKPDPDSLKKLCSGFFAAKGITGNGELLWDCQNHPDRYLEIERKQIIESSQTQQVQVPAGVNNSVVSLLVTFSQDKVSSQSQSSGETDYKSHTKSNSTGVAATIAGKLGLEGLGNGGSGSLSGDLKRTYTWSVGQDQFVSTHVTNSQSQSSIASTNNTRLFSIDDMEVEFQASVRNCVVTRLKGQPEDRYLDAQKSISTRIRTIFSSEKRQQEYKAAFKKQVSFTSAMLVCTDPSRPQTVRESFYFVTNMWRHSSAFSNARSPNAARMALLIRGKSRFQNFYQMIQSAQPGTLMVLTKVNSRNQHPVYSYFNQYLNQEFPGVVDLYFP